VTALKVAEDGMVVTCAQFVPQDWADRPRPHREPSNTIERAIPVHVT
jgi:hypothetical protein